MAWTGARLVRRAGSLLLGGLVGLAAFAGPAGPTQASQAQVPGDERGLPVVSRVDTRDPVFFVTIDDGTVANKAALRLIRQRAIPVTVFLTNAAIGDRVDYFRQVASFGGSVQNHTNRHPDLTQAGVDVDGEICGIQQRYERLFGAEPWLLRPPYGAGATSLRVQEAAASCGISVIVTWDVVVTDTDVQYVRAPVRSGDIVLLHFTAGLDRGLARILALAAEQHLRPAALTDYLQPRMHESVSAG